MVPLLAGRPAPEAQGTRSGGTGDAGPRVRAGNCTRLYTNARAWPSQLHGLSRDCTRLAGASGSSTRTRRGVAAGLGRGLPHLVCCGFWADGRCNEVGSDVCVACRGGMRDDTKKAEGSLVTLDRRAGAVRRAITRRAV